MIALVSDRACNRCPLSLVCKTGQPILPRRSLHLRFCTRCFCVIFEDLHETYICGLLRLGYHNSDGVPIIDFGTATRQTGIKLKGSRPPHHGEEALRCAAPDIHTTFAACEKVYRMRHPLRVYDNSPSASNTDRYDKRDCIKYYRDRKQFTEER